MDLDASQGATIGSGDAVDPLVLALDVGTSSARVLVYDALGRMIRGWEVHQPYSFETTRDGGVFMDADKLLAIVATCLDQILHLLGKSAERLAAVACDTFWHSLMGLDRSGRPVTPVYTWADTRSSECVPALRERLDEKAIHSRTGVVFHSSYWPAKMLWLEKRHPDTLAQISSWVSFGEYLYLRLFGQRRVSISMASGTGLMNQKSCTWDEELLDVLPMTLEQLSPITDFSDAASDLHESYRARWRTLRAIPWYLALGDGGCNNVGSGGFSSDWMVAMIGTSGALRVVSQAKETELPWGLWTYRIDRRRCVLGGSLSDGGNVFAWLSKILKLDIAHLEGDLAAQTPDGHGLTILPFLAGERSPDWNPQAQAAFVGMTLDTDGLDIVRASLEAVAYRFSLIYGLLKQAVKPPKGIIGSGVALVQSPTWMQIMSDVLGEPLVASAVIEATSRGAALLVLESLGVLSERSPAPAAFRRSYVPQPKNAMIYQAAIERQQALYTRLFK